jgi:hypothetical protein
MGGGVAGAELAAAVSEAGGLGTIGILPAPLLQRALARARKLTAQPIAVNLLLPFTRPEHWALAGQADVVVTFWGAPVRRTSKPWIHQCGSVAEAHAAQVAGADAVITQGVQAGGHVRGTLPALRLLERVRAALPGFPVLLAGGVADAGDVRAALDAGAAGVVSGPRGPVLARAAQQLSGSIGPRLPMTVGDRLARAARIEIPLYGTAAPLASWPQHLLDTAPLYAGESVARITDIRPRGRPGPPPRWVITQHSTPPASRVRIQSRPAQEPHSARRHRRVGGCDPPEPQATSTSSFVSTGCTASSTW